MVNVNHKFTFYATKIMSKTLIEQEENCCQIEVR